MRCLADFERELIEASTMEEKFNAIFKGLILNVFSCGLRKIDRFDLANLELKEPQVFETVKDKNVRQVLVKIGMFEVDIFKNPDKNAVELRRPIVDDYGYDVLFEALYTIGAYKFGDFFDTAFGTIVSVKDLSKFYGGSDAVKVFLKALYALCKYVCSPGDYRLRSVNEENYSKLKTWLSLDHIETISHRRRIEDGIQRSLGPIYGVLEKHKSTIKRKIGLTLS